MSNSLTKTLTVTAAIACTLATAADAAMTISNAKTKNMSCARHVCTPTGGNANLNAGRLQIMLAASDVTVKSNAAAPDMGILDSLTWASTHRLTLDAYQSIHVRAPVVVEGTAGVTLITNDGGTGGDYDFNTTTSGFITFWDTSSSLIINGAQFVLAKDIKTLATGIATNPSGNFALAANYDAAADGVYSAAPLPRFSGNFEGLANTIENLKITSIVTDSRVGLFSEADSPAVIRDLNLSNANVSGTQSSNKSNDEQVGILAGYSSGTIIAVNASGTVVVGGAWTDAGGLVGAATGLIEDSTFTGTIKSKHSSNHRRYPYVGGIVGWLENGTIQRSSVTAQISNGYAAGGILGYGLKSAIAQSRASANVEGTFAGAMVGYITDGAITLSQANGNVSGSSVGGLVGFLGGGSISQSFAASDVSNCSDCGGIVGSLNAYFGEHGTAYISQSYATGSITGGTYEGGLSGELISGDIEQSYAVGPVGNAACAAGFTARFMDGTNFSADYWNTTTTGRTNGWCNGDIDNVTGLTDDQLKSALPAGFDPKVWGQNASINNGWPYLLANPPQ